MPTLTDLYNAQKADKYTQDGRETLDKVYQIGEISQKTGLQKTANGWVQPKKMLGGKAKKPDGDPRTDRQIASQAGYSVYRDGESKNGEYREFRNGDDIIRFDKNGYDDRAGGKKYSAMESGPGGSRRFFDTFQEAADWVKSGSHKETTGTEMEKYSASTQIDSGKHDDSLIDTMGDNEAIEDLARDIVGNTEKLSEERQAEVVGRVAAQLRDRYKALERESTSPAPQTKSATTGQNKLAEIAKISGNYKPENLHAEVTPKGNIAIIEKKTDGQMHNIMTVDPKAYHIDLADLDEEGILDRPNYEEDSAPRQLTGDTRLRLSQVTDRVYKPGEISEKTGLQKQTDGSWAPPKKGKNKSSDTVKYTDGTGRVVGMTSKGGTPHKPGSLYKTDPAKLAEQARKEGNTKKAEFYEAEAKKETSAASQKPAENKGMNYEENKYQERKKAQQVEAARQNKNYRDFYDNTGLTGRGGPEEALARNEADKEDRKQDNLKAGKRDDSMFKQNDKIEFNRAGHYINGKIEKVDKDWQGNVSLYVRGDDGKGYWVETNNVTKHQTGDRAPLTGDTKIRVKK